jgi:hypothetical protein
MKNSYAIWSKRLKGIEGKGGNGDGLLSMALAETEGPSVAELRKTILGMAVGSLVSDDRARLGLFALECAKVCEECPSDFEALCGVMKIALKGKLPLTDEQLTELLAFVIQHQGKGLGMLPVGEVVAVLERRGADQKEPGEWRKWLAAIRDGLEKGEDKKSKSVQGLVGRINGLLDRESVTGRLKPDEGWADSLLKELAGMGEKQRGLWEALLAHASKVSPEAPVKEWDVSMAEIPQRLWDLDVCEAELQKVFFARQASTEWRREMARLIQEVGVERFEAVRVQCFKGVPGCKPGTLSQHSVNREIMRGLIWTCEGGSDEGSASALRMAAEYMSAKNSPLVKAGIRVLASMTAGNTLEELVHLAQKVELQSQRALIDGAMKIAAERMGLPSPGLGELPLPDCGFKEMGRRVERFGEITGEIVIGEDGGVELRWLKANGERAKSVPAKVMRELEQQVKDFKAAVKDVKATLAEVKERLEGAPIMLKMWGVKDWRAKYVEHPVAGVVARSVVWEFEQAGRRDAGILSGDKVVDASGREVEVMNGARVRVWHPISGRIADVQGWRQALAARGVRQPFKQVHREVYVLTEAERRTGVYSNRFAGHILRQSQFRALAKGRGWKSDYQGGWDGGGRGVAERTLAQWELRAQLWTDGVGDEFNDAGGYTYLSTDQVRFFRTRGAEAIRLEEVPAFVMSEVMRDVDLFVGVGSVGNDPTWRDGGADGRTAEMAGYWERYAFGELMESAVTRRAALEQIVPRLKIAGRCSMDDRFLTVRGDLRTYRIHIGSGNILMEPGNQYLCIVEARAKAGEDVYLPFEGDHRLSVILSKAMMLAEDKAITDETILTQIRGG